MPRYHFHVRDGRIEPDHEGTELAGLFAACVEAVRTVGKILKDHAQDLWNEDEWRMEVTDATGLVLFTLMLSAMESAVLMGGRTSPSV